MFISTVVLEEIKRCKTDEKQHHLHNIVDRLNPTILTVVPEITELANTIIKEGAIPPKNEEDAYHLAFVCLS